MSSPYKLRVHKWMRSPDLKINFLTGTIAQSAAVQADTLCKLLQLYRTDVVDRRLPARPKREEWLRCYNDHRRTTFEVAEHFPQLMGSGKEVQATLDETRFMTRWAQTKPDEAKQLVESLDRKQLQRGIAVFFRFMSRAYRKHLLWIRRELADEDDGTSVDQMERSIHASVPVYFFIRVWLPCLCVYQTFPHSLVRHAGREGKSQLKALERLVRLDDMAIHLNVVERWQNGVDGEARVERRRMVQRWASEGMGSGRSITPLQVKASVGGLIWAFAKLYGTYWQFGKRGLHPPQITAKHIADLFHAVAQDRAGRRMGVCDQNIAKLQHESWRAAIRRQGKIWDQVIRPGGGWKLPPV